MGRVGLTLAVFLMLSAWAGAQRPEPVLTAADQLRLLRANRVLLADLVDSGVKLGATDHPLDRATACRETARVLGIALERAAEGQDPDRVAELGGHLEAMVRDGLVPNLEEARKMIPDESPQAAELKKLRARAVGDLDSARSAIPATGTIGDNERVKDVRGKLDGLRERLKD